MSEETKPLVGVIMGSHSDWSVMENCAKQLKDLGVPYEAKVIRHTEPRSCYTVGEASTENGMEVIIAAAGGAAHLAGVTAAIIRAGTGGTDEGLEHGRLDSCCPWCKCPAACRSALWRSASPAQKRGIARHGHSRQQIS